MIRYFIFVFLISFVLNGQEKSFVSRVYEEPYYENELGTSEELIYKAMIDSLKEKTRKYGNQSVAPLMLYAEKKDSIYKLYISNSSKDSLVYRTPLGYRMITEAKNQKGEWKPISYIFHPKGICGNASFDYILPYDFLIFQTTNSTGKFKTKITFNFLIENKTYYSNEFEDYIDEEALNLENTFQRPSYIGYVSDKEVKDALLYNIPYAYDYIIYKQAASMYRKYNERIKKRCEEEY